MDLKFNDAERLIEIVRRAAQEELIPRFAVTRRERKADGSIVTEADRVTQRRLIAELQAHWPQFEVLGEEMPQPQQEALLKQGRPGLWLLDPLDGTSNFAAGVPFYSISLALMRQGRIELGLVYDPSRDETFIAERSAGAYLNGRRLRAAEHGLPESLEQGIALLDLKRLPSRLAVRMALQPPFASQRNFGSVALEWCWLAAGRGHLYLHGKQQLWDYAAGHRILLESGGEACTFEGRPVFTPSLRPRSVVAAGDHNLFHRWRRTLAV